jgi:hypothetical protein
MPSLRWPASLLVLLALVAALARAPAAHASGTSTRIDHVEPFDAHGRVAHGWTVSSTGRGYCWTSSNASPRRDAYRCFLGNSILDPCFADPAGITTSYVLCVTAPWTRRALKLRLTRALPAATTRGHATAWAIMLPHHGHCQVVTGAGGLASGRYVAWYCDRGGVVAEGLRRGTPWWAWYAPRVVGTFPLTAKWRRAPISWLYI